MNLGYFRYVVMIGSWFRTVMFWRWV